MAWILGYGSLLNAESRAKTVQSGTVIPVRVLGLQRSWCIHIPNQKRTTLGAVRGEGSIMGLLFSIPDGELGALDAREGLDIYERVAIDPAAITVVGGGDIPDGTFWIYLARQPAPVNDEYPIAQSYLDVNLIGCFALGDEWAESWVRSFDHWDVAWIDDRDQPVYPRPHTLSEDDRERIDAFLRERLPEEFTRRATKY